MDERLEQALIVRAKEGDRLAYERLLELVMRPGARLAFAMLHDHSEAEDVFQESALRAWRRLGNLRTGSQFRPWFLGIVANQCREVRRGRWRQLIRVPDVITTEAVDESAWLEGEDVRRAIAALPYDQRVAVLLHFHLDLPLSEVAVTLGISPAGVRTRIKRALRRLRPAIAISEAAVNG